MTAVGGLQRVDDRVDPARRRRHTESLADQSPQLALAQRDHAAELHAIDGMERKQHVAETDAVAHHLREHLHVVEPVEAGEVPNGFADVAHRERSAHLRFEEPERLWVRNGLTLLLDSDLCDRRRWRAGRLCGDGRASQK
jgi:hypothetical protein